MRVRHRHRRVPHAGGEYGERPLRRRACPRPPRACIPPAPGPCCGRTRRHGHRPPAGLRRGSSRGRAACGSWWHPPACGRRRRSRALRRAALPPRSSRPRPGLVARRGRARGSADPPPAPGRPPGRRSAATAPRSGRRSLRRPRRRRGCGRPWSSTPLSRRTSASSGDSGLRPAAADQGIGVDVHVGNLTASVHPGVGAARHGHRGAGGAQHGVECLLEVALHGAQAVLPGPAVEGGPVVGEVDAQPHGRQPIASGLGCCPRASSHPPAAGAPRRRVSRPRHGRRHAAHRRPRLRRLLHARERNGDQDRAAVLRGQPLHQPRLPGGGRVSPAAPRDRHRGADRARRPRGRPAAARAGHAGHRPRAGTPAGGGLPGALRRASPPTSVPTSVPAPSRRRVWPGTRRCRSSGATAPSQGGGAILGWLLGATIGPGTIAVILLLGPAVDLTSRMLGLDVHQRMEP